MRIEFWMGSSCPYPPACVAMPWDNHGDVNHSTVSGGQMWNKKKTHHW